MKDEIKKIVKIARDTWGTEHVLVDIFLNGAKQQNEKKCTKCGIRFVWWSEDAVMKTECVKWRSKLIKLIDTPV